LGLRQPLPNLPRHTPVSMHPLIRRSIMLAAALTVGPLLAQTTLIDAKFDNGNKDGWLNSSSTGITSDPLSIDPRLDISAGRHALRFFSPAGGYTLSNNSTITATLRLTFTSTPGNSQTGFRMGLFYSNGATRPSTDNVNSLFQGYDGYIFTFNPAPTSGTNSLRLREREPAGLSGLPASTALVSTLTDTSPTPPTPATSTYFQQGTRQESAETSTVILSANRPYDLTYTVTQVSDTALIFAFRLSDPSDSTLNFSNSFKVDATSTRTFDAFAIYSVNTNGSNFAIDNVLITAVPEPSTYAACAGAAVLGLAFWRRRRAAAKTLAA